MTIGMSNEAVRFYPLDRWQGIADRPHTRVVELADAIIVAAAKFALWSHAKNGAIKPEPRKDGWSAGHEGPTELNRFSNRPARVKRFRLP